MTFDSSRAPIRPSALVNRRRWSGQPLPRPQRSLLFGLALGVALVTGGLHSARPAHAGLPPANDVTNKRRGFWEAPYRWQTPAIHMCLLKGNPADSYAQILWWASGPDARVWHWNPGDTLSSLSNLQNVPTDHSNIFCGGHSVLEDGRLLTTGGTELGDQGLDHVNIFDPQGSPPQWRNPRPRNMVENRYYPTNTTLGDGSVLVSAGQRYQEVDIWGGEREGQLPVEPAYFGVRGVEHWLSGTPSGEPPSGRVGASMVFGEDSDVQSLVGWRYLQKSIVFGGEDAAGEYHNDVWGLYSDELANRHWQELHPDPDPVYGYPDARRDHAALFMVRPDSAMVIFGGRNADGVPLRDVWKCYSNGGSRGEGRWQLMTPTGGDGSLRRSGHGMVLDADHRVAYVFGGEGFSGALRNDVWRLDLSGNMAWQKLVPTGGPPAPRTGMAVNWDPSLDRQRMLVFGGSDGTGVLGDLWELSQLDTDPTWTLKNPTPDPSAGLPPARAFLGAFFDDTFDRWTILGGDTTPLASGGELDDVWSLKLNYPDPNPQPVWTKDPAGMPDGPRAHFRAVVDTRWVRSVTPEIFFPQSDFWLSLTQAKLWMSLYPHMFLLPSGKIFFTGPNYFTYLLNLETGHWEQPIWSLSTFRGGTAVQYLPGKILKTGDNGLTSVPTSAVIDLSNGESGPGWREVSQSSLMLPRVEHNMTILPTGEVLVTGGLRLRTNIATAVRQPQIWNPNTETWTDSLLLAPDPVHRDYHSTALLLPDGRILSGGGDLKSSPADTSRLTATIYWPPYLFDSEGNLAPRPTITGGPEEIGYGQTFLLHVPDPEKIRSVVLMRPGCVTHAFNQEQRYVPLQFSIQPGTDLVTAVAPAHMNLAPVGNYLLFAVNQDSVPSIGRWIKISQSVSGAPIPPVTSSNVLQIRTFPNPFSQVMTVAFFLPERDNVQIDIFDASGRRVRDLVSDLLEPGAREVYWDGRNDGGQALASGIYFMKVRTSLGQRTEKLILASGRRQGPGTVAAPPHAHH